MKRRTFVGGVAATGLARPSRAQTRLTGAEIPTLLYGKTGVRVPIIAQGGARMDLHPDVRSAAEEAYGIGLNGVRTHVFLTTKTTKRTRKDADAELETSLRLLKTDHVDIWQMHGVERAADIERILGPGGAMEAFEAAKKAGKARFIGFTGHYDPEVHAALLKAYPHWDSVLMPLHAADHAYLSFEKTALPIAQQMGIGIQAIKVFCKAFLLRALNPTECLRYTLSQGVHVAICGAGTTGQMEDNIRAVQGFKPYSSEQIADIRKRAIVGQGVYTGPAMEYWKKKSVSAAL
jgi:uncharacterized protein